MKIIYCAKDDFLQITDALSFWGAGQDRAWDCFEDLMRTMTLPREMHDNFTNKLRKVQTQKPG